MIPHSSKEKYYTLSLKSYVFAPNITEQTYFVQQILMNNLKSLLIILFEAFDHSKCYTPFWEMSQIWKPCSKLFSSPKIMTLFAAHTILLIINYYKL